MTEFCLKGKMYTPNYPIDEVVKIMDYYTPQHVYFLVFADHNGDIQERIIASSTSPWLIAHNWITLLETRNCEYLDLIPLLEEC